MGTLGTTFDSSAPSFVRAPAGIFRLFSLAALAATWLAGPAPVAQAACNVIPAASTTFRGALGSASRPFAKPGDLVDVTLDQTCQGSAPPFSGDEVVTLLFRRPAGGARNALVLRPSCSGFAASAEKQACEANLAGGVASCVEVNGNGEPALVHLGAQALRFEFPDTDPLLFDVNDDLTLSGPTTIAVTAAGAKLPCDLAGASCPSHPDPARGLKACVDRLFADDGTCNPTPDATFASFTALPPPNDFSTICTDPIEICHPLPPAQRRLRAAIDAQGNVLIPMDWRGILVKRDAVRVARRLRGRITSAAFPNHEAPLLLADPTALSSFSPGGVRIAPIFDPQIDPTDPLAAAFFGTADADETVLRVARHPGSRCVGGTADGQVCRAQGDCPGAGTCAPAVGQCSGGTNDDLPCLTATDCPGGSCGSPTCFAAGASTGASCGGDGDCAIGECGRGLFDFTSQDLTSVGGPLLLDTADVVALDPVPLDGLNQTAAIDAFVEEEAIIGKDLNGDRDATDHIAKLTDRLTGKVAALRNKPDSGRAVARVKSGPFSAPALVLQDDVLAFLEPETAQHYVDRNKNGQVFEDTLRAYRLPDASSPTSDQAVNLLTGRNLTADPAPMIDGHSLALSGQRIFFRSVAADDVPRETTRVSVSSSGEQGNGDSGPPVISADGRFVVFPSDASNLVAGDTNGAPDIFVHDGLTGETTRVSVSSSGEQADGPSRGGSISADGKVVAFSSAATNLVSDDTNEEYDAFVHDRLTGATTRVSVSSSGEQATSPATFFPVVGSFAAATSADGRFIAFYSSANNLVSDDTNETIDSFVHDRLTGETTRVSVASGGGQVSSSVGFGSFASSISGDGRVVAFTTDSASLVPRNAGGLVDDDGVFVHDRLTGETTQVDVSSLGEPSNNSSFTGMLSADGRFVSFQSGGDNLVPGDTNGAPEVLVHDRDTGETTRVSASSAGEQGNSGSSTPSISADGRYVAFTSSAPNLVRGDTNTLCSSSNTDCTDVFVHDLDSGATTRVSVSSTGAQGDEGSENPSISADGRFVAFSSRADNLVAGDSNGVSDVFVRGPAQASRPANFPVLRVIDVTPGTTPATVRTLCPASLAATSSGKVAFLRPERAGPAADPAGTCPSAPLVGGNPDLNGDGDTDDDVVQFWSGKEKVRNLGVAAADVALSDTWIAALVVTDTGTRVQLHPAGAGDWTDLGHLADAMALSGSILAFREPGGEMYVADASVAPPVVTDMGLPAEDFVVGPTGIVAFRTREAAPGRTPQDLNGDGDTDDDVLEVFVPDETQPINTHQAVTPCLLEACNPRVPYRVSDNTVKFLTLESDQGQDLDGDGKIDHLVVQVFNAPLAQQTMAHARAGVARALRRSSRLARGLGVDSGELSTLAATSTGVCTNTAKSCATSDNCGSDGTCFVPPGGCVRDLGTACDPTNLHCEPGQPMCCDSGQFCLPGPSTCHVVEPAASGGNGCRGTSDCNADAVCNQSDQSFERLAEPLLSHGGAAIFIGTGHCLESRGSSCGTTADCGNAFCDAGTCRRDHGLCTSDASCPAGVPCVQDLLVQTAVDSDGDGLPDAVDNCPNVANVMQEDADHDGAGDACDQQTCGNGKIEPGEPCDDGNQDSGDTCDCSTPICDPANEIRRAHLEIRRLGGAPSDERLSVSGRVPVSGQAQSSTLSALLDAGLGVIVENFGAGGRMILDLSRRTTPVPGPSTAPCDAALDGWTVDAAQGVATYTNGSNALPGAGCALGSASGLRQIVIVDRRGATGTVKVTVRAKNASLAAPRGPLRATLIVGAPDGTGASGPCGLHDFSPDRCALGTGSRTFTCRP